MKFEKITRLFSATLRRQLIWGVAAVHAVLMSLFIWDLSMRQQEILLDQQSGFAQSLAHSISTSSAVWVSSRDLAGLQELIEAQRRYPGLKFAIVLDKQGAILAHTDRQYLGQYMLDLPSGIEPRMIARTAELVDVIEPVRIAGRHAGWVRVGIGAGSGHAQVKHIIFEGVLYALVAIVIGAILAVVMAARLTRRLDLIQTVANAVQAGDAEKRVQLEGNDEAAKLGQRFNVMLDALAERERGQKDALDHIHKITSLVPGMIYQFRLYPDGRSSMPYTSGAIRELYRLSPEEVFEDASKLITAVHPEDLESVMTDIQMSALNLTKWQQEYRVRFDDGTIKWLLGKSIPQREEDGSTLWHGFMTDVTESKLVEMTLRSAKTRLSAIYDSTSDALMLLDENGFFDCNKATLAIFGCATNEEFCLKHPVDLSPSMQACGTDSMTLANRHIATVMENGSNYFEWLHRRIDTGKIFACDVLLNRMVLDDRTVIQATVRDITERKKNEAEIVWLGRLYSLLSRVNETIVRAQDRDELFSMICKVAVDSGLFRLAWVGMLDKTAPVVIPVAYAGVEDGYMDKLNIRLDDERSNKGPTGRALREGVHIVSQGIQTDPAMLPWRDEAIKRGYHASGVFPIREADVVVGTINVYAVEANFFTEDIIHVMLELAADMSFSLDVFAEKNRRQLAEDEIKQLNVELESRVQERTQQLETVNRELEAFSYSVSHDLRAPLRSIDGFSQILSKKYHDQLDATGKDYLERVRRASQHMGHLIDDMLLLSQVTRGLLKREQIDLSKIAENVVADLRKINPGREVHITCQQGMTIHADSGLMRIVMVNLLGNACKYTGKKTLAEIEFGEREMNGERTFFVRDNGVGFNMEYAHKLFGAFQRLHSSKEFEGTGIGLATVQRIINRHHGKVWAEAKEGEGATFYFTIPQREREA